MKRLALALALLASPALAHDAYLGLRSQQTPNCCDNQDCHPAEAVTMPDGSLALTYQMGGQTIAVPEKLWNRPELYIQNGHALAGWHVCVQIIAIPGQAPWLRVLCVQPGDLL